VHSVEILDGDRIAENALEIYLKRLGSSSDRSTSFAFEGFPSLSVHVSEVEDLTNFERRHIGPLGTGKSFFPSPSPT
jgi:hypothetical protein